ncbi:MAG: ABC transporter permease [Phycisphaerales bacterium]
MSGSDRTTRSWFGRLLRAQESGLVVVILLLSAFLAIASDPKPKVEAMRPDPGSGAVVDTGPELVLTVKGVERRVEKSKGWEVRGDLVRRERMVNAFLDPENLVLLAKDASFVAVMAVGMTAIIVLGGIDLSVGSIYGFAGLIGALVLRSVQANALGVPNGAGVVAEGGASLAVALPIALLACCGTGAACGALNGGLVVGLRLHPFIVTLGTLGAIRGLSFVMTKGLTISGVPESLTDGCMKLAIAGTRPVPVFVMLGVCAVASVVLARTVFGRSIYAIGGNETAAKYCGVPVGRVKVISHTLCGLLAGLSACMAVGYFGSASPGDGEGYELKVIAAAVIGGAALSGGRGSALGAVLGAVLVEIIHNALLILNIDPNYYKIAMGASIVGAVVLDQAKGRLSARR